MPRQKNQEEVTLDTPMGRTGIRDRAKESISSKNPLQHGSNCRVFVVETDEIPVIWDSALPLIRLSQVEGNEMSEEDFFESLMNQELQLWVALEENELLACMVTRIVSYPQKRLLRIIFIGGKDMDKWLENLPIVENFALTNGCTSLEIWGRKGWLKILKDWECTYHIITKDLTGRMH